MKNIYEKLPLCPGVYLFKDQYNQVIYVGKAKNLKNRVSQYFKNISHKNALFVKNIVNIEYVITKNEQEALLLELNLIKENKPRYNILLKDDKTYPYICLTNEIHPKIITKRKVDQLGQYFGPFPDGTSAKIIVQILNRLFKFRKCNKLPKKDCLYNHINECYAPCIKEVKEKDYFVEKKAVIKFLQGDSSIVLKYIKSLIFQAAKRLDYETAQKYKKMMEKIIKIESKQKIISSKLENVDYINYYFKDNIINFFVLHVRQGKLISTFSESFHFIENEKNSLKSFLINYYNEKIVVQKIYLPIKITKIKSLSGIEFVVPEIGNKKKLLIMALENAVANFDNKKMILFDNEKRINVAWNYLATILKIKNLTTINIFDCAHLFGENYVGAKVHYCQGYKVGKKSRKYNLNQVIKSNDTLAMKLLIEKRFKNDKEKIDLIIVDGGKPQVNIVKETVKKCGFSIPVAGLIKNQNHKTKFLLTPDGRKIKLIENNLFLLLAKMQEDVHKLAINYHRKLKRQKFKTSIFNEIKGLGPKRIKVLLSYFITIENIKNSSVEQIAKYVPLKVAKILKKKL